MVAPADLETLTKDNCNANHYVPEFVLKHFAPGGLVCIFDKHTSNQFKLPTKRAMGERDYNNVRIDNIVVSFEDQFSHVENF